jgi:hypothetical protein
MHRDIDPASRRARVTAALLVVVLGAVVVTPLCGALFGCGCTWPWSGLDRHCNVHDPNAPDHCPWCVRPGIAATIFVAAAGAGAIAAFALPRRAGSVLADGTLRALAGLACYVVMSALGAYLAGRAAGYPHFLWW